MSRPLRYVPAASLVEITTRTIQSRFLLRPSAELNDLVLGVLGRAQFTFGVRLHAFVVLSNHYHLLCSVEHAAQLASFMAFVNGNIAREIGRLHDWSGRFWERRYRAIVVADDEAAVARLRYIFEQGCKEGLVDRPVDWPGVACVRALTAGQQLQGTWYDRTAESNARRQGRQVIPGQFAQQYRVDLSPLPAWAKLSPAWQRQACAELIASIEGETRDKRAQSGGECVGLARILAQDPHHRPRASNTSPAPLVHAACREIRRAFRSAYEAFVEAFRTAAECLRNGLEADFPLGSFPPGGPFVKAQLLPD